MKKLLLLGGSPQQVIAIETANRLGYYTIVCDYLDDNPGQYYADRFYQVSTTDKQAVLSVARAENIDGIIAYASDPAAPTAAYVAGIMGLPGNPYTAVETLCNKDLFRRFLSTHNYYTPYSHGFKTKEEALERVFDFNLPIIIKPVDSSGSRGVTVKYDLTHIETAIEFAFSYSRAHRIIVEEYIEQKTPYLIGGDIFVSDGKIIQYGLMNCHRDHSVNPLVPTGKSYPPLLEQTDLVNVKNTLQQMVTDIGIRFGPMNVELIIDNLNRVYLIDIGPRNGGNMIPDLLSMVFGCDVVEMSIQSAMGKRIERVFADSSSCYATLNIHSNKDGFFDAIEISPEIQKYIVKKYIYKNPGDKVSYFENATDVIGIVFFHFPDKKTMIEMEECMNEHVRIILQ